MIWLDYENNHYEKLPVNFHLIINSFKNLYVMNYKQIYNAKKILTAQYLSQNS